MPATVQWEAHAGVTHAWIAQCEGYVSLCGREVTGFHGQRSGIRCGPCAVSAGWAEKTGSLDYLTPHPSPLMIDPEPSRTRRPIDDLVPVFITPREEPIHESQAQAQAQAESPTEVETRREISEITHALQEPLAMDAYGALPEAEQRYWAAAMLGHLGELAIWEPTLETAEAFQQRCYARLAALKGAL
jgi:hypothetical protein